MTLLEIVEQLKSCGYRCEAGSLEMNTAFVELERMATVLQFHVIVAGNEYVIAERVQEKLSNGWRLSGDLVVYGKSFVQSMIRP